MAKEKSLADMAKSSGDTSKLTPEMRRMRSASAESSRRNPGNSVWIDRRKARGTAFPFFLKAGEQRKVLVLSQPHTVLAHKFQTNWINKGGSSFPETEWGVCTQWKLPEDPDQESFDKTGQPCGGCMCLGEPRSITIIIICEFYDEPIEIRGKKVSQQVRPLVADSFTPQAQIIDQAGTDIAKGDIRFCFMKISRSQNQQSPRVGDSFTILRKIKKDQVASDKRIVEAVKAIDLAKAYAPLTLDEQKTALLRHRLICDKHSDGDGYDPEGMEKVQQGNFSETESPKSGGAAKDSGETSLAALADAEEGTAEHAGDAKGEPEDDGGEFSLAEAADAESDEPGVSSEKEEEEPSDEEEAKTGDGDGALPAIWD